MHVANNLDVNDSTGVVVMTYLAIITHKLISRLDSKREVLPVIEYRYIWAYYAHGRQRRCQEDPVSPPPLQQSGEDNQVVPASCGSAPSNRIWNNTTLHSPKQQISELPSLEDDIDVWRYAILSCTPETMTIGIVGFNVPLDTLQVISETILQVICPNQHCHSTEGRWLVNQVKGQSHQAQLSKGK